MKNIKFFTICCLTSLCMLFNSCDLDEINKTNASSDNYITSEQQYEELVTAVYQFMRPLLRQTGCMWWGTDIIERTGEVNNTQVAINDYTIMDVYDATVYNWWVDNYYVVTKANVALNRGENLEVSDDVYKKRTGEVLALRAYAYFNLVETFGGVPVLTDEITSPQFTFARDTEEAVYTKIEQDLRDALDNRLPAKPEAFGRVSQGMAKHLLGKVLLTRSYKSFVKETDLTEAIQLFGEVISLHPMENSWNILFGNNGYKNNNSEAIFSVRYSTTDLYNGNWGNNLNRHFKFALEQSVGNTHRGAPYFRANLNYKPTLAYLNSFEDNDIRVSETYLVRNVIAGEAGSTWDKGDVVIYFPKVGMTEAEKATYMATNPTVQLVINPDEYHKLQILINNNVGYPIVYKFFDPGVTTYTGDTDNPLGTRDTYVFRTAETMMLLAEAHIKNNNPGGAESLINQLRVRASLGNYTGTVDIDAVLDESGRELFGESNRWMDLKRTGKLFERAWAQNAFIQKHHSSASDISSNYLVKPIPGAEIERTNKTLKQNPGYAGTE